MFNVYSVYDLEPVSGDGCYIRDASGTRYLDLYGGHAVISVGHSHPKYVARIREQAGQIGFYSNSVKNPLQDRLAHLLGEVSGYRDYRLFLCNSGAEANENALKLASFHTERTPVFSFQGAFHGRTSAAVSVTDNPALQAPLNRREDVRFLPLNDTAALEQAFAETKPCAVIIEGIQGIGGVVGPQPEFFQALRQQCDRHGAVLILDEVQSGYGRTGQFFAHQYAGVQPDLITVAKGMGNGFPIAGVLIHPRFQARPGLLGSTFGGNHLACAAGLAVLEIIRDEELIDNARSQGEYLHRALEQVSGPIREVRGTGLMLGVELEFPCTDLRKQLLFEHHIFTGSSANKNTLRILPPLSITRNQLDHFLESFQTVLQQY